jgi:GAF domain-containing protein
MIRLAVDEDFNGDIVRGVLRRNPALDVVRVQDVALSGADDDTVLAWAASEDRIFLTHDVTTMTRHAYARVDGGQPMAGVGEYWVVDLEARDLAVYRLAAGIFALAGGTGRGEQAFSEVLTDVSVDVAAVFD